MNDNKGKFTDEVNNRLGEFFGKMEQSGAASPAAASLPQELFNLKAIVLSVEWEITDETMMRLIEESDRLAKIYRDNKVVYSLLKLLDSVGRYVNAKKANSHPDSIKLLHSIHDNLQQVATAKTITESQSRKLLSTEIEKFKNLKQLLQTKAAPPVMDKKPAVKPKPAPVQTAAPTPLPRPPAPVKNIPAAAAADTTVKGPKDNVLQAIDDLKRLIQDEMRSLREELKQLRR